MALHIGAHDARLAGAPMTSRAGDWTGLAAELGAAIPGQARLVVTVADCWVRYFLLAPPDGAASLRDGRLLLASRFEALYGQSSADWVLQADWQAGRPMLACALPRGLDGALAPWPRRRVQPALLALWNGHCARLPHTGVLCAQADGQANLLYWNEGAMRVVRQQKGTDATQVDALLALELARQAVEAPAARYWSGAGMPAGWIALEASA